MKKVLILIGSVLLLAGGFAASFIALDTIRTATHQVNSTSEPPKVEASFDDELQASPGVRQDPEVLAALQTIGAKQRDLSDLELRYAPYDEIQAACEWEEASGCFTGDYDDSMAMRYVIYAGGGDDEQDFLRIVAHEYLHYVWQKDALASDSELIDALYQLYRTNPDMRERISPHYTDTSVDISDEIFSYGCTEFSSSLLGEYLSDRCNQYISTSALTPYF